jgi:hypothetical protein
MNGTRTLRWISSVASAVCVAGLLLLAGSARPEDKPAEHYTGKVVALAKLLEKKGVKLDADAAAVGLALVTEEGKIYPLIKDDGSRMFFLDKTLLDRPMRLTGAVVGQSDLLQVVNVHSLKEGNLHEVYYWCDVCRIRRSEKKDCECCGAPMELREVLVK